jgi:hypothetical protein
LGFAVGYVLGARAGRERYQQLRRWWNAFAGNPTVQRAAEKGREIVSDAGRSLVDGFRSRKSIGDLAVERDPDSALADISAGQPNR